MTKSNIVFDDAVKSIRVRLDLFDESSIGFRKFMIEIFTKLPDEFSRTLLRGSIMAGENHENPIRLNLFAAGLRELFGYLLDFYSPGDDVRACAWFVQAKDTHSVTRAQRAMYATQGGLSDTYVESLGVDPTDEHRAAIKAIASLNKFTHVRPGKIVSDENVIKDFMAKSLDALEGLLTSFEICQHAVRDVLVNDTYNAMMEALIERSFEELDLLSGRGYEVGMTTYDEIKIIRITSAEVQIRLEGQLPVTFHYGSKHDAAAVNHTFQFWMSFKASVSDPTALVMDQYEIDESSWYGDQEE